MHEPVATVKECRSWRGLLRLAFALPAACWLLGAVLFLRANGSFTWHLPRLADDPTGEHNLAFYRLGPTLRASSYYRDVLSQHHPAFVLDGRAQPGRLEKWTSGVRDGRPWLEVLWHRARVLKRVVIRHAGSVEEHALTIRDYRLRCLRQGTGGTELAVHDNRAALAEHSLICTDAVGIRIDWQPNPGEDRLVRIYELEAWGR